MLMIGTAYAVPEDLGLVPEDVKHLVEQNDQKLDVGSSSTNPSPAQTHPLCYVMLCVTMCQRHV